MDNSVSYSDAPQLNVNEVTSYHEAGHAVMARLFGRRVHHIDLDLNVEGTYNGKTDWDRDELIRVWDPNVPYDKLGLQQAESNQAIALVYAAGKAAERILYRQRSLDETRASFGPDSGIFNDERQLEMELLEKFPWLKPEDLPEGKQAIEKSAVLLLGTERCWQAVEAVAQALMEGLKQAPEKFRLKDVQNLISNVFAQQH